MITKELGRVRGELRRDGCQATAEPVYREVLAAALNTAEADPRFAAPVRAMRSL